MNVANARGLLVPLICLAACGGTNEGTSSRDVVDGWGGAGPAGPPGPSGASGPAGVPGPAGERGAPGGAGGAGPMGLPGADGRDGADGQDGADGRDGADGQDGADGRDGADGQDCSVSLIADGYEVSCANGSVYVDTTSGSTRLLSGGWETSTEVELIGSKRNGGSGQSSRWFDFFLELASPTTLALPNQVPAEGSVGNGQKLYVLFNGEIDCAWFSHANQRYQNPRCFVGATRNGGTSSGFTGGSEVASDQILAVETLEIFVAGAQGSGTLATATATFTKQP